MLSLGAAVPGLLLDHLGHEPHSGDEIPVEIVLRGLLEGRSATKLACAPACELCIYFFSFGLVEPPTFSRGPMCLAMPFSGLDPGRLRRRFAPIIANGAIGLVT